MFGMGLPEFLVILLIVGILIVIPAWIISKILIKAGFSGWYSLLGVIPLVNILALWVFAFIKWPAEE